MSGVQPIAALERSRRGGSNNQGSANTSQTQNGPNLV